MTREMGMAAELRALVAGLVVSDPGRFNPAFLGMAHDDYAQYILDDNTWGSALEVALLSEHYAIEICVVIIQTMEITRFGLVSYLRHFIFSPKSRIKSIQNASSSYMMVCITICW